MEARGFGRTSKALGGDVFTKTYKRKNVRPDNAATTRSYEGTILMTYLGNNRWIHIGGNSMVVDGRRKTTNGRSKNSKVESTLYSILCCRKKAAVAAQWTSNVSSPAA